ncbi:MAG: membrane dipeptidase, partial [Planctomycetaceae bacterium]|nr:membrane dipeptidase [Planctomycetaceae bacterium]
MERRTFLKTSALAGLAGVSQSNADLHAETDSKDKNATRTLTERLNPKIQRAREVALSMLKPSPRDLERGLRLHSESLVFDAYAFSPRAAIDGEALAKAVEAGASEIEIKDLREEMAMTRYATDSAEQQEYLDAWRASGVTCIFQNAGEEGQDPMRLIKRLARFTFATDILRDFVSKAAVPEDIVEAKRKGQHCLYLTGNGVPLTQQWETTTDEMKYMRIFFQLGIRMMHMTYNRRNMLGDG